MITLVSNGDYSLRFEARKNGVWLVATLNGRPQLEVRLDATRLRLLRDWLCVLEMDK
jgi:hypothetical protein